MRYVEARLNEFEREEAYRIYVTKSLQLIPQNSYIKVSYMDLFDEKKPVDNRTGEQILLDVMRNAGLKFEE